MTKYCKSLKFEDDANYDYLQQLLKDVFVRNGYDYDFNFDWRNEVPAPGKKIPILWGEEARKFSAAAPRAKAEDVYSNGTAVGRTSEKVCVQATWLSTSPTTASISQWPSIPRRSANPTTSPCWPLLLSPKTLVSRIVSWHLSI